MYENDLKENDKYIIFDAGGGTVDLATFESTASSKTAENESFRRCQLTADSGDKCGSVFLDEQMQKLLLSIFFGLDKPQNDKEKKSNRSTKSLLLHSWKLLSMRLR
jgi:molecular chaperone DnaK (HSP70)